MASSLAVDNWLSTRMPASNAIPCFPVPNDRKRLSIVTDSVGPASLFGGVGTSIILATLMAQRMKASLRLVTRTDRPDARAIRSVLDANGLSLDVPLETVFVPPTGSRSLPVSEQDYFLTTSWWSTRALLGSIQRDRIAYLLQEDERMFYPYGDTRLACEQTLNEQNLFVVVNTRLLHQHLSSGPESLPELADRSTWFEPAFPGLSPKARVTTPKRRFFFYARPSNPRNLFNTGVAALADAISNGLFPPSEWEIHFVGKDIPELILPRGIRPYIHEGLSWNAYQSLVRSMDAGFVLMGTPHPSYPPLDLAAHGAAVLTTTHGIKTDLSRYSENIIMASPEPRALAEGLARLVRLAGDDAGRAARRKTDGICRDWRETLEPTVDRVMAHFLQSVHRRPLPCGAVRSLGE